MYCACAANWRENAISFSEHAILLVSNASAIVQAQAPERDCACLLEKVLRSAMLEPKFKCCIINANLRYHLSIALLHVHSWLGITHALWRRLRYGAHCPRMRSTLFISLSHTYWTHQGLSKRYEAQRNSCLRCHLCHTYETVSEGINIRDAWKMPLIYALDRSTFSSSIPLRVIVFHQSVVFSTTWRNTEMWVRFKG